MPKRVSIRGQGAALFFGETALPHESNSQVPDLQISGSASTHAPGKRPSPDDDSDGMIERTNGNPTKRSKVRHSFDVYQDQLFQLSQLQMILYKETGKKPALGDLVQQALDAFLRTNSRSIERPITGKEEA